VNSMPRTIQSGSQPAALHARGALRPQRGIALIIGLIILAVLSMIGVAAFSISTQEERMAGNSRDRMRAFEAAEAALRSCEDFVQATGAGFGTSGQAGMYVAPSSDQPSKAESITDWTDPTQVFQLTTVANPEWSRRPACVAEYFTVPQGIITPGVPPSTANMAHITAQGFGLNSSTVVRLESYYAL